jgi:hypothetical protein
MFSKLSIIFQSRYSLAKGLIFYCRLYFYVGLNELSLFVVIKDVLVVYFFFANLKF